MEQTVPQQSDTQQEVGFVKSIRNFLVYLDGLPTVKINDIVITDAGIRGWVSALLPDRVEMLLLDEGEVQPGDLFKQSGQKLVVPVGNFLLGRAINPLGVPIDGKGPLAKTKTSEIAQLDKSVPNIASREFINRQFDSGITVVDTIIPLGKGQRELVIGDARSGKTDFLVETIVNQKNTNTVCVYASIGKPIAEVRSLIDILRANGALTHTILVAASSTDIAPLIFLTPEAAFSIAEYFQRLGQDVLLILDDMGNHAKIYREISLLSNKSPGRESYPGDIFYQHSHLLERAGNFNKTAGGGSITALPVIELNLNDFTGFIPTNLMSMTDGHLLFKSALYNQGQRPAIDISLSVTRVGQQTQNRIQNLLATKIKQVLAQAAQLETISRFSFELPFETQMTIKQKVFIDELTNQPPLVSVSKEIQVCLLALPFTSFIKKQTSDSIKNSLEKLIKLFTTDPELKTVSQTALKAETLEDLFKTLEAVASKISVSIGEPKVETQTANTEPTAHSGISAAESNVSDQNTTPPSQITSPPPEQSGESNIKEINKQEDNNKKEDQNSV